MNRGGVAAPVGWVRQFWDEPTELNEIAGKLG